MNLFPACNHAKLRDFYFRFSLRANNTVGQGRRLKLSNGRTLVNDVIRLATGKPYASLVRDVDLSILATLRRHTRPKIAWNVLLMKAYCMTGSQFPELRQLRVSFPWPHLYEHHENVCMLAVTREHLGEERLFFARFNKPEEHSLTQLQTRFDRYRRDPVEQIPQFKHQVDFSRLPLVLRRLGWGTLACWPNKSASHMGTCGMSLSGYRGAYGTQLVGPCTTMLGVDPTPRNGISRILFTFDHRVLDGKPATDILESIYSNLTHAITWEVKDMLIANGLDPKSLLQNSRLMRQRRSAA